MRFLVASLRSSLLACLPTYSSCSSYLFNGCPLACLLAFPDCLPACLYVCFVCLWARVLVLVLLHACMFACVALGRLICFALFWLGGWLAWFGLVCFNFSVCSLLVLVCLSACLLVCLSACVLTCLIACLLACLPACFLAYFCACAGFLCRSCAALECCFRNRRMSKCHAWGLDWSQDESPTKTRMPQLAGEALRKG